MIPSHLKLDRLDLRILSQLQQNGRITNVDLADAVGLSASPCLARVKRLEQAGYIIGYGAEVRLEKLGETVTVFTEVTPDEAQRLLSDLNLGQLDEAMKAATDAVAVLSKLKEAGDTSEATLISLALGHSAMAQHYGIASLAEAQAYLAHPVLGPRLKLADLKGRALMVHAGGDNHADHPAPLGGGGARVACGGCGGCGCWQCPRCRRALVTRHHTWPCTHTHTSAWSSA